MEYYVSFQNILEKQQPEDAEDLDNSIHWDLSIPFQETIKTGDLLGKYPAPV